LASFVLRSDGEVRYSRLESLVFQALTTEPQTTSELAARLYGSNGPYNSIGSARAVLYSIAKKMRHNNEPFRLKRSKARGPHPISWWLEEQ
jgi:hypothetical protein